MPESLPPALRARLLADVSERRPTRPRLNTRLDTRSLVFAAVAAWVLTFAWFHGRRANWAALPPSASWGILLELALASLFVNLVALARGVVMVGPSAERILWAFATSLFATALAIGLGATDLCPVPPDRLWWEAVRCDLSVVLLGLPLLGLFSLGQRNLVMVSPGSVGAVAGLAAGTWSHAILHWGCVWTDVPHILLGHVVPTVPLALAGALLFRRLRRRRPV